VKDQRAAVVSLIDEAVKSGARIEVACAELGLTARTIQRWRRVPDLGEDARHGPASTPKHSLSRKEQAQVLEVMNSPAFRDLPPAQIVARLADEGRYVASESTMYRLLRGNNQDTHRHQSAPRTHQAPKELVASGPNQVWSWDITYLPSTVRGRFFYLYLFVDVWSRRIMKAEVHDRECGDIAAGMLRDACREHDVNENELAIHADNGAPMKAATMLATMRELGVLSSFSRPHVSDDNPFSEALFRTLKYVPSYPRKPFASVDAAWAWVERFVAWYNDEHRHSGIGFVTPDERHRGDDIAVLRARRVVYENARAEHPDRWSRATRAWDAPARVVLNPQSVPTRARAESGLRCGADSLPSMAPRNHPAVGAASPRCHEGDTLAA
jgi:transposase InsO family protein